MSLRPMFFILLVCAHLYGAERVTNTKELNESSIELERPVSLARASASLEVFYASRQGTKEVQHLHWTTPFPTLPKVHVTALPAPHT